MPTQTFAEILKSLRRENQMSQTELANALGYSDRTTIAKLETNISTLPDDKYPRFAEVLNTTVEYLKNSLEKTLLSIDVQVERVMDSIQVRDSYDSTTVYYPVDIWEQYRRDFAFGRVWRDIENARRGTQVVNSTASDSGVRLSADRCELLSLVDSLPDDAVTRLLQIARLALGG